MTLHAFDTTVSRKTGEEVTVTVPLWSSEPGILTAAAPGCTFPDGNTKVIAGTRTWRTLNYQYLQATKGNAAMNAATAVRDQCTICMTYDLKNLEAIYRPLKALYSPTLAMSMKAGATNRMNWAMWLYHYNENQSYFYFRQSVDNATDGVNYNTVAIGNGGIYINRPKLKLMYVLDGTTVTVYWKYFGTATPIDSRTLTRLAPVGTMGSDVLSMIGCEDFAYYARKLDAADRGIYAEGGFPATPVCAYPMNEEAGTKHYDLYGTNDTELGIDQTYGFALSSADNRNTGPNRTFTDAPGDPVVPASSIRVLVPAGVASPVTLTLTRPRQGVPSRATDGEKYETASGVITLVDPVTRIKVGPRQIYGVYL